MSRPTIRSTAFLFVMGLEVAFAPSPAQAQTPGAPLGDITTDPFAFYYAYYLPNQQLQALRPKPIDTINQAVQLRQYYAQTERRSLYDPISPYTDSQYDPLRPYSQQGRERIAQPFRFIQNPSNADGSGPSLYYNRAAQYFPGLRPGRGPNVSVAAVRRGVGGGGPQRNVRGWGSMSMPGMGTPGMGMPGLGMPG
jgi:hypothetical protein